MKFFQNIWRSIVCFVISCLGFGLLLLGAIKISPILFQEGVWAKIGLLAVGIEIGAGVLYFATLLLSGTIMGISQNRKIPIILSILPMLYALIRYPWWLISVCNVMPFSLGFLQWLIIITWIAAWVLMFVITIVGLFSNMIESQENK